MLSTNTWRRANSYVISDRYFAFAALAIILSVSSLRGQDRNHPTEPIYPATCGTYPAPLATTADGPGVGETWAEQDYESRNETRTINDMIVQCSKMSKGSENVALELTTGNNGALSAFLIKPIKLPSHVSLIVDGGVTVYGSRDPGAYQIKDPKPPTSVCGETGTWPINSGCKPLIELSSNTGIYGNGVIDGQGDKLLLSGKNGPSGTKSTWWDLTLGKNNPNKPKLNCSQDKPTSTTELADGDSSTSADVGKKPPSDCEQESPLVVSSLTTTSDEPTTSNLILYKITIRNPPYHTTRLLANNLVVWSVKVQSPWNIPNTDGFDVQTTDATFYDDTVANGDQEITIVSSGASTSHMTIENFRGYGKGGITILGNGKSVSQILVDGAQITGDLPSVTDIASGDPVINGVHYSKMEKPPYSLTSWGQALPNATGDLKGLQISDTSSKETPGSKITGVTYRSVCISDIVNPIDISLSNSSDPGYVHDIYFENVHVLKPTAQFPLMKKGAVQFTGGKPDPGKYNIFFDAPTDTKGIPEATNEITFDNLVFDDGAERQSSIGNISAKGNQFTASTNAYPRALYQLMADSDGSNAPIDGIPATLLDNKYSGIKGGHDEYLGNACHSLPFITGDLSLSTNQVTAKVHAGDSVTLNAVVQPTMSQTTLYVSGSYGANPGLLSVGSPALTNAVQFYDGFISVGSARLTANGTLASFTIPHLAPGRHYFRALYPADRFYSSLPFGLVTIVAEPAAK